MNWEYFEISMAPRAGRIEELRDQAARERQALELIRERRSRRAYALRSRLAKGLMAVADIIAPSERPPEVSPAD